MNEQSIGEKATDDVPRQYTHAVRSRRGIGPIPIGTGCLWKDLFAPRRLFVFNVTWKPEPRRWQPSRCLIRKPGENEGEKKKKEKKKKEKKRAAN